MLLGPRALRIRTASASLGGLTVVSVAGEVDLATAPTLESALRGAPGDGQAAVILDPTECAFMGLEGVYTLERTHRHLDGSGGRLAVVLDDVNLLRLFRLTELDRLLEIFPSRAAALNGDGR